MKNSRAQHFIKGKGQSLYQKLAKSYRVFKSRIETQRTQRRSDRLIQLLADNSWVAKSGKSMSTHKVGPWQWFCHKSPSNPVGWSLPGELAVFWHTPSVSPEVRRFSLDVQSSTAVSFEFEANRIAIKTTQDDQVRLEGYVIGEQVDTAIQHQVNLQTASIITLLKEPVDIWMKPDSGWKITYPYQACTIPTTIVFEHTDGRKICLVLPQKDLKVPYPDHPEIPNILPTCLYFKKGQLLAMSDMNSFKGNC